MRDWFLASFLIAIQVVLFLLALPFHEYMHCAIHDAWPCDVQYPSPHTGWAFFPGNGFWWEHPFLYGLQIFFHLWFLLAGLLLMRYSKR